MNIDDIHTKAPEVASLLKSLAHPKRLLLVCNLLDGEKTVGELEDLCGMGQSQTSQYLKRLELENILSSKREGRFIYYTIKNKKITKLITQLQKIFC